MKKRSDPARIHDAARLLPILGVFLLMPPIVTLFAVQLDIAGVPLIVIYVFGVWLALIACAALIARRVAGSARDANRDDEPHA